MNRKILLFILLYWGTSLLQTALAEPLSVEVIQACVMPSKARLSAAERLRIAECLDWQSDPAPGICLGRYVFAEEAALADNNEVQLEADEVSLRQSGRSVFRGKVKVKQQNKQLQANTAYVYRDVKSGVIQRIVLLDGVRYVSPEGLVIAQKAIYQPQDQTFQIEQALYRLSVRRHGALLDGWGRAQSLQKTKQNQFMMAHATYTHCSPLDKAWEIRAGSLALDQANNIGTAKDASLNIYGVPVLYSPYMNFPLSKKRKSGFLMPTIGSTTVGGIDVSMPYYLNLAPNYDATLIPHLYTKRGLMYGGQMRYLTSQGSGMFLGNILPQDRLYGEFLNQNTPQYPSLANQSTNRWDVQWSDQREILDPALTFRADVRQLSDNYYLQDFSTNLGTVTERQILRQGALDYNTDHWLLNAQVQSYQTLHPLNETPVANAYDRLPQLLAIGEYGGLPLGTRFDLDSAFDYFHWTNAAIQNPDAARYHLSPRLAMERRRSWGYVTPSVQWVGNAYSFSQTPSTPFSDAYLSVPRFNVDSGLTLERSVNYGKHSFLQTLEPRLYYLNVPYQNQAQIPVFESGYMIFTEEQVFRNNRFSGFDRIGDANQLAYGMTTRWLSGQTGDERASLAVAQLAYFANRQVGICSSPTGICQDNPLTLGYLSQTEAWSPIASHGVYHFNSLWSMVGDYAWDPATSATNNTQVGFRYHAEQNRLFNLGYTYLVNGDLTQVGTTPVQQNALSQISASYAWPYNDRWSSLGAYSYNMSKQYQMMALFGVQYDSCCWAARLIAGQTFRNLNENAFPQYTNSIFFQVLLKGLGSVGSSDPTTVLRTFLPSYQDSFKS
ncbi:MAG: LPS-assembly protein LptD [Gammaproteobacteria bacterium]|nr:LPS-assembly protein LptD [Gammaproteobacteria bacterium]